MNAEEVWETLALQCSSPGTERAGVLAASALKSHYSFSALHLVSCSAELQHARLTERHLIVAHFLPLHGIGVLNTQKHTHNRTESLSACFDTWSMHLQKTNHSLLHFIFFLPSFNKFRVQQVNLICGRFASEIQFAWRYDFHRAEMWMELQNPDWRNSTFLFKKMNVM